MLYQVIVATLLVSVSVALHAIGMVALFDRLVRVSPSLKQRVGTAGELVLLIQAFVFILALHLLQIGMWAGFYVRWGALQDFGAALYFSIVSYATVGYGDVVLPPQWRLVGAIEGITGILLFGWSTGFIFVVVSKLFEARLKSYRKTD
jgi:voltage-gated potassium channel